MISDKQKRRRLRSVAALATLLLSLGTIWSTPAQAEITYYHWDALGSPVAATNEQGDLVWREDYKPYGEKIRNESAAATNTRAYTGHVHDNDTGLTYAGARFYDPVVGRFMAVDPVTFKESALHSFNRYVYVANNPMKFTDPDGRELRLGDRYEGMQYVARYVFRNPNVIRALGRLDFEAERITGHTNYRIQVTDGDRYLENGQAISHTTGKVVTGSIETTTVSEHLDHNGNRGVDVSGKLVGITKSELREASENAGFAAYNYNDKYEDGHIHISLPKDSNGWGSVAPPWSTFDRILVDALQ